MTKMASAIFFSNWSDARHEPVLFTVVNGPQLTSAISRRCAIARRRRRAILFMDAMRYAVQPRAVLADVSTRAVPRHRAGVSSQFPVMQNEEIAQFTGNPVETV